MKKILKDIIPYIVIIVTVVLIRSFLVTPVRVAGYSMYPTFDDGQILILNKTKKEYKRFNVVVVNYNGEKLIKRVIGLPGEHIQYKNNKLYVNGKYVKEPFLNSDVKTNDFDIIDLMITSFIPKDSYLVLGDNRENSTDSRVFGFVKKDEILGTTVFSIFPFTKFGTI